MKLKILAFVYILDVRPLGLNQEDFALDPPGNVTSGSLPSHMRSLK